MSEQATLPFGTALNAETSPPLTTNNKRFTSYDRSEKTKLDYAVNRTYDSKLGRFTQVDPIGMSASSLAAPQTLNMYSYCGNDPVNHTDPSGLFWGFFKKLFKWLMVAVAVVVAIMTIVAAPFTIAGILGMISAASGAASSVLGALGYNKAAMIFGLIALGTGFGSLIAGHMAAKQAAAAAAARTPGGFSLAGTASEIARTYKDAAMFGILSGVGAIANSYSQGKKETGSPKELRITFFRLYGRKFNKCLKEAFGKDYAKIGRQGLGNSPVLDASLPASKLGEMTGGSPQTVGGSDPFFGKHGKVFVSRETYHARTNNVRKAIFGTYAHETAIILDIKLNPNEPQATYGRVYGDPNDPDDTDTGGKVEKCLFGSLQVP